MENVSFLKKILTINLLYDFCYPFSMVLFEIFLCTNYNDTRIGSMMYIGDFNQNQAHHCNTNYSLPIIC